jgi:hypothetical protein
MRLPSPVGVQTTITMRPDSNEPLFRIWKSLVGNRISQSGEHPFDVQKIDAALAKRLRPLRRIEADPHRPSCSYRNHLHQGALNTLRSARRLGDGAPGVLHPQLAGNELWQEQVSDSREVF